MLKIAIIGYSGSGKSTLASFLGQHYNCDVLHLDKIHFTSNWQERTIDEMANDISRFMLQSDWIIEGNYSTCLYEERMREADCIIYYDRVRCRFENEPDKEYVIVCFDVEKFKFVNDRFGFVEGDRLLSYIGKKLQERAAKYGLVAARLSGDVFSFMDFEENIQPDALGAEIQSWVKDYPIDFEIRMTVGIYHVKTKNIPVRLMCDRASFACESIKNNYLVNVAEYNDSVKNYVFSQHELLNESERAFENHEFKVYLQPKYDIRTTKVMGAESLVR